MDKLILPDRDLCVIVTGSRKWGKRQRIVDDLDFIRLSGRFEMLLHGANPNGADMVADQWGEDHPGAPIMLRFPADWSSFGSRAGPIRNLQMLHYATDWCADNDGRMLVLAYPLPGGKGTQGMMDMARRYDIPVFDRSGT